MGTTTVLLVGVGGQGTILAGDLLAKAAAQSGLDVKISEIHGMSQRGGSVSTVVRFGDSVASMVADPGTADVIVSFEAVEALRAQQFLNKETGRFFVNDTQIVPVSVSIGNAQMPNEVNERLEQMGCVMVAAGKIAQEVGSPKSANVVLMGALSTALPFSEEVWKDVIAKRVPKKTIEANLAAFDAGVRAVSAR
jgi:indolepyruvate ferredoxin oxidoreductase beta subunit